MMSTYLSLDLDTVIIEPALALRLPPGLAAYYLALPIGSEDGYISVAMAHPDNESALAVLGALLGGPIVAVRAKDAAIRQALAGMVDSSPPAQARVLVWSADPEAVGAAGEVAGLFAGAIGAVVTALPSPQLDFQAALAVARAGAYDLAVVYAPAETTPARLIAQAATPLLVLEKLPAALQRILVVLRGFSADCQALDWLAPLMEQRGATVTLLPLPPAAELGELARRRAQNNHLQACLQHRALQDASVLIRFRQGRAAEQVVAEVDQGAYDLVAIAAEGYGHFVSRVLLSLEQSSHRQQSFLILKPPVTQELRRVQTRQQPA